MGCINGILSKNTYTEDEYLKCMIQYIASKQQHLCLLLDQQIFKFLQGKINQNVWPSDNKGDLIRLLEDYIRMTRKSTQNDQINKSYKIPQLDKNPLEYFGQQFGKELKSILERVEVKNKGIIETLQFYPKVYQYQLKLDLDADNPQSIKQIRNFLENLQKYSYSCQQAYFYLSLILVRVCRRLQPTSKLADLNKILGKTFQFINLDFIDTPQTQIAPELRILYHNMREVQYDIHKSIKTTLKEDAELYQQIKMENKTIAEKQQLLEDKIMELVQDAKQKYQFFQSLFYKACKNKNTIFRINLKLKYRQNQQALQRVKQKILFRQSHRDEQLNYESIDQMLQKQKQRRKNLFKEKLQQSQTILLRISDLLRGKCLFLRIQDVNEAVVKVIKKINQLKSRNIDVQLVQIDNRLQKITNDIVLKIKFGKLVTEFQFAFYGNNLKHVKNQIYHRVYELFRSKTMSNISMLFAWHQKMAKNYIKFLKKVFEKKDKKEIQARKITYYNDLLDNLYVSPKLNQDLREPTVQFQKIAYKNDITSLIQLGKMNKEKKESIKQGKDQRTAYCYEQIQDFEKCLFFIQKACVLANNNSQKQKLEKKTQEIKQKRKNNKIIKQKNNKKYIQNKQHIEIQDIQEKQSKNLNKSINKPQSPIKRQESSNKPNDNKLHNNGDPKNLQTKNANFSKQENKKITDLNPQNSPKKSTNPITSKEGPATPSDKQRSKNDNPVNKKKSSIK